MLTRVQTGIVIAGVAIVAGFSRQSVVDAVTAGGSGTVDIAVGGHFSYVAILGELNHAIAAGGFRGYADPEVKRARVAIGTICVAVAGEAAVFGKLKGELAGAQSKTEEGDEHECGPQGLRAYSMHGLILPEFRELAK